MKNYLKEKVEPSVMYFSLHGPIVQKILSPFIDRSGYSRYELREIV